MNSRESASAIAHATCMPLLLILALGSTHLSVTAFAQVNEQAVSVQVLASQLGHTSGQVRRDAVKAIIKLGPAAKPAIPALRIAIDKATDADDGNFRYYCMAALDGIGPEAIPTLMELLTHRSGVVRRSAAGALGKYGPSAPATVASLFEALKDPSSSIRTIAVSDLKQIGRIEAHAIDFGNVFKDCDVSIRIGIIQLLGKSGANAVPSLVKTLRNGDQSLRYWSIVTLGEIGPDARSAVPQLIEVFHSERPSLVAVGDSTKEQSDGADVRGAVVKTIGEIGPAAEATIPFLKELFEKSPEEQTVVTALAQMGEAIKQFLLQKLDDGSRGQRLGALNAMFQIPGSDSQLHHALQNSDAKVRQAAASGLGARFKPTDLPHLVRLLKDEVLDVRRSAMHAIAHIGDGPNNTVFREVLAIPIDDDSQLQYDFHRYLEQATQPFLYWNEANIRIMFEALIDQDAVGQRNVQKFFGINSVKDIETFLEKIATEETDTSLRPWSKVASEILERKRAAER